jgi:4-hydroxybenzoate polyprenyltransferase
VIARIRTYGSLVAFSHTVFAMPFAGAAVILALAEPHVPLTVARVLAMVLCMVAARTSAMAFNRWADRHVDAENPRTRSRHLPAGVVKPREALAVTIGSGLAFLVGAATLGFWPAVLAPGVLLVLLGYSFAKRFTWGAHAWLGVALALAPGGAWLAVGAAPGIGIVALMVAVTTWLLGFDVLYSLQDETFDRARGLHSIPARFGTRGALVISSAAHIVTVLALAITGLVLHRGLFFALAVVSVGALLVYEHALVGFPKRGPSLPGGGESGVNLAKINKAFFDVNAWVSVGFFALVATDALAR